MNKTKDKRINVRVDERQHERLHRMAKKMKKTVSRYLLDLVEDDILQEDEKKWKHSKGSMKSGG